MTPTINLFLYGTLRDPELLRIVSGRDMQGRKAHLVGYETQLVEAKEFPALVESGDTAAVEGVLVQIDEALLPRFSFYEVGSSLAPVEVETEGGGLTAYLFKPDTAYGMRGSLWNFEEWSVTHAALTRETAIEFMRLFDTQTAEQADRFRDQIEMRAATRLRAAAAATPSPLSPTMQASKVRTSKTRQPYSQFFAIQEDELSFPRFDGTQSPEVKRACFIGGDAVTVLPWDPATDKVLLIRQFRHGPFCRGDGNPWTLEPVAGRIDPGETPEQTALRELREETRLHEIKRLHPIARYYPSPGAVSEFLYSYVAEARLEGEDGRVAGLSGEAEDIKSHVLPLETALQFIPTGAANTGPLIASLQWLAMNRDRLVER